MDDRAVQAERAARLAAVVAGGLALLKLAAGALTGSLSVMASSLDSLMDALASGTNMMALRWSRREPTRVYAFGYGKVQALAGLLQGVFISASALGLGWAAIGRFLHSRPLERLDIGIGVMVATALASAVLSRYLQRSAARTETPLLASDALHYATDLWANAGALAAMGLERLAGWSWFDPVFSLVVAAWVTRGALRIASGAVSELLDHGLPEDEVAKVGEVVSRYAPEVRSYHDLRTRRSGHRRYIDFHIVIQPTLSFAQAHELTDRILTDLEELWPGADVTIHPDPKPDARLPYAGQG